MKNTHQLNGKVVYDSARRDPPAIEEFKILIKSKDLLAQLVRRDIVSRYKRSVLGIAWTMLNPLGIMLVMTIVFSNVFNRVESYPVYLLAGLLIWNFFTSSTQQSMNSIVWGSKIMDMVNMPSTSFSVATIGTATINLLLSLVPLFVIMLITHVKFSLTMLLIPIPILFVAMYSLGVGLMLTSVAVFFPDMRDMYEIILRALLYLTPVIVPEDILAKVLNGLVLKLNPLYYIIKIFRLLVIDGEIPPASFFLIGGIVSLAFMVIGWFVFTSKSDKIAYYV